MGIYSLYWMQEGGLKVDVRDGGFRRKDVSEEAGANPVRKVSQIDEGEKVDSFEFAINRGWATNAAGNLKVRPEKTRRASGINGSAVGPAIVTRLRRGA